MFTNFDCDCFWVADRSHLTGTFSVLPEYLRNKASESGEVIDYRDWHVQLGRRFRSLKLWFVIRHYGIEGLRHHIRYHVELARRFAASIKASEAFELVIEPPLNLVCFRYRGTNEENLKLMEMINQSGDIYLTHTKLKEQIVLRMCIAQTSTTEQHVARAWKIIRECAEELKGMASG